MVSSYTANLAAFLTVEPTLTLIESAEQLEKLGGKIQYGAKKDGSTLNFFKNAEYETYKRMYLYMNSTDNVLTGSNEEGLEKVKKEHYAYLMESTSIEYYAERECNTTQVGGLLDEKGYGIAMRKSNYCLTENADFRIS
jgi:glutamate receptor, ionotropic, invertebrate